MRSFDIFASTAWILYSFEISKTCKNGRFFTFRSTFLDGVAKIRKFSKKESNVNNLDICSYHFIVNWLIFAHAPSLQLCTTEFFCGFLGQCVNFKSVPDRQKLFKSPQIFCVSSTLCWLYAPFYLKRLEQLFQTGEYLEKARKRKNSRFCDFESGSRFMRLLNTIEIGSNHFFSSKPIKLHRFVKFLPVCTIETDFRGLWILKNVPKVLYFTFLVQIWPCNFPLGSVIGKRVKCSQTRYVWETSQWKFRSFCACA